MKRKRGYIGALIERVVAFKLFHKVFHLKHRVHAESLQISQVTFNRIQMKVTGSMQVLTSEHEDPRFGFHPGPSHRLLPESADSINDVFRRQTNSNELPASFPNIICF